MMDSPCKDCPDRYPACHDHCERYKQWRAEYEARTAERKKKLSLESSLNQYKYDFGYRVTKRDVYRGKYRKIR